MIYLCIIVKYIIIAKYINVKYNIVFTLIKIMIKIDLLNYLII